MLPRQRVYKAVGEHRRMIREVVITETYRGSCHWNLVIYPEGYGSDPHPIEFCRVDQGISDQDEGYGIFRPENAHFFAWALTGQADYNEYVDGKLVSYQGFKLNEQETTTEETTKEGS